MESVAPHVLALDDDPDIRKVLTQYLSEQDLRITAVSSGRAIVNIIDCGGRGPVCAMIAMRGNSSGG